MGSWGSSRREEKRGRGAGKPPPRFQSEMLARGMTAMMALLAAMALAPMVAGQVLTPDEYRTCNVPPSSNDTVDVYTSALLERLIDVNDRAYEFTALLFLYFSWEDPTAMDNMITPYHTQFSGLIVGEDGKVGWYKSLYGKYFTNMQFSMFPLDTQRLQISLGLTSVSQGAGSQTVRFVP